MKTNYKGFDLTYSLIELLTLETAEIEEQIGGVV